MSVEDPRAIPGATDGNIDTREGFLYALSAYILWGFLPLYMKAVSHIPALEVVAHRVLWSVPIAGAALIWMGRTSDIHRALRSRSTMAQAALTATIISINWAIYVWAVFHERTLEAALGYYINPLFSIFLASLFLRERLTAVQWLAIGLALVAVVILTVHAGGLPWVSIALTVSFGLYALCKKTLPVGPNQGFFLEVLLLTPFAAGYAIWLAATGAAFFTASGYDFGMLLMAGAATAIPLMLYANGAKKLRLSTIGIMQYIAPTIIFLIAVFVFGEPFDKVRFVAFLFIWTALALYSFSLLRQRRRAATPPAA